MNYQSRFLLVLSSLAVSGYLISPIFSSTTAYGEKTKQSSQKTVKSSPHANNQANVNDDDDDQDDNGGSNDDNKNPTQALFEAINVGNLQGARDALDRGADLHAANILGQTPLEMSIDLNRDRITFLLLSMRGYNNSPQSLDSSTKTEIHTVSVQNDKGYLSFKGQNQKNIAPHKETKNTHSHDYGDVPKPEIGFLGFKKTNL